jgi:hypothetical protein
MLNVFLSVALHTIGRMKLGHGDYLIYHTVRDLTYFLSAIIETIGLVQITRSFLPSTTEGFGQVPDK